VKYLQSEDAKKPKEESDENIINAFVNYINKIKNQFTNIIKNPVKYFQRKFTKKTKEKSDSKDEKFNIDQETLQILALYLDKSYQNIETFTTQFQF
jgi:hypothetical protein